jgi:PAS domain S-box-containing protein/putative nucleotidyltransferase with HDIG domain
MTVSVLLAVDDRVDNLFVLEQLVKAYLPEIKMITAESAESGLKLAAFEALDGALIDVQMPGLNGIEMCRRLKADPRTASIHVILVTAHQATSELKAQGLEAGADDFIAKPIDNVELAAKLRVMMRLRAAENALRRERDHLEQRVQERALAMIAESSQRQEAEEELARTRLYQELILNSVGEGILGIDLEGQITFANPAAAKMLGYESEVILGQPFDRVCPLSQPDGRPLPKEERPCFATLRDGKDRSMEGVFCRQDGASFPGEGASTAITERGKITGAVITLRDITERQQAEATQALQATRLQALLDLHLLAEGSQEQLIDFALEASLKTTQSEYCFVGLMDEAESVLRMHRWSKKMMTQCSVTDTPILYPVSEAGLWGDCVRQRKAVLVNDYQAPHPSKKGLPDGHVPIQRFLAVPVLEGGRTVIVAAVANKGKDYGEDDVVAFTSVLNKMWEILRRQRAEKSLKESLARTIEVQDGTMQALATVTETRDPYTAGHQRRVAQLACAVAQELGFSDDQVAGLRVMALLHDLGKISIPAEILSKPGKLSAMEFDIIKSHSRAGYEIVKEIPFAWPVAEVILQHHERLDGSGYPQGLQGDEIVLEAKILAVADVVEAMSSHRPYRPGLGIDKALDEIAQNKGVLYEPEVVDVCLKLFNEKGFHFD